jgi:simple sugar transport system substrate-binding protein/ribose transport system substrate-binding protein
MKPSLLLKRSALAASIALLSSLAAAAGLDDPGRAVYQKAFQGKRVVFIPVAMSYDLAQGWSAGLRRELEPLGGKFEIRDPNWNTSAGAQAITSLIAEKPDAIVVNVPDVSSYSKLLQRAEAAGIHVVQINMRTNVPVGVFIGADFVRMGEMAAERLASVCKGKSGKIALVQGVPTAAGSAYLLKGVENVLAKNPQLTVVSNQAADWDASKAKAITQTVLQQHKDLCGVVGFWDGMDSGTSAAIKEAGMTGKVTLVSSGGGNQTACDAVKSGAYDYYISFDVPGQVRDMSTLIRALLSGAKPGAVPATIYNNLVAITKDNADSACWSMKTFQ